MADSEAQGAGGIFWWAEEEEDAGPTGPFHVLIVPPEGSLHLVMHLLVVAAPGEARSQRVESAAVLQVPREHRVVN